MASTINADTTNGVVVTSDTSGEIELQSAGVTKAKVTANGLQDNNGNSLRGGSFRNLLINGDMNIAQRGTSVTGITGTDYYTVDRYRLAVNTMGTFTMLQDTDVPTGQGFTTSLKLSCTTADTSPAVGDSINIQHRIEGQNLQHLKFGTSSAESLTLSFWVKSNKTGTYTVWFYQQDDDRQICPTFTIDSADTWEKKTITVDGDTSGVIDNNNGDGLRIGFFLGVGSDFTSGTLASSWEANVKANRVSSSNVNLADSTSNYINITGVQLEVGEGASDFEFLPYDVQLARCQRYYIKITDPAASGVAAGGNSARNSIFLPVTMRATPTVLASGTFNFYNGSGVRTGTVAGYYPGISAQVVQLDFTLSSGFTTSQAVTLFTNNGNQFISSSAEL